MRFGVAFPTTEIGRDPAAVRDFVQAAEALGYDHLTCIDHVLGAREALNEWRAYYTRDNMFHEIFVLFGFIAAVTRSSTLAAENMVSGRCATMWMMVSPSCT